MCVYCMYVHVCCRYFGGSRYCMYLHVCAGICLYFLVCSIFLPSLWHMHVWVGMHMCVYVCVYTKWCSVYLHVSLVLVYWATGAQNPPPCPPKHSIVAQHQAGPTQSTPGHVPIHFIPIPVPPLDPIFWENWCLDLSCHGRIINQDPPDRLKRGPIAS